MFLKNPTIQATFPQLPAIPTSRFMLCVTAIYLAHSCPWLGTAYGETQVRWQLWIEDLSLGRHCCCFGCGYYASIWSRDMTKSRPVGGKLAQL